MPDSRRGGQWPTTPEADAILKQRDEIFVLADVALQCGGVIVSYFEWVAGICRVFFWVKPRWSINSSVFWKWLTPRLSL